MSERDIPVYEVDGDQLAKEVRMQAVRDQTWKSLNRIGINPPGFHGQFAILREENLKPGERPSYPPVAELGAIELPFEDMIRVEDYEQVRAIQSTAIVKLLFTGLQELKDARPNRHVLKGRVTEIQLTIRDAIGGAEEGVERRKVERDVNLAETVLMHAFTDLVRAKCQDEF